MQDKAQHTPAPWTGERTGLTSADTFFTPPNPSRAKSGHAMESLASKLGAILVLLAISSVAAVGVFMPEEEDPLASPMRATNGAPPKIPQIHQTVNVPRTAAQQADAAQQAYTLAYELARQRVTTVGGLTRQQRLDAAREAVAQVLGGDVSQLDPAATLALAKQAPDTVKDAAIRGVSHGEAKGISVQSQLLVERMLNRERRPKP